MTPPKVNRLSPEVLRAIEVKREREHLLAKLAFQHSHKHSSIYNEDSQQLDPRQYGGVFEQQRRSNNGNGRDNGLSFLEQLGIGLGAAIVVPPAISALAKATKGVPILGTVLGGVNDIFKTLGLTRDDNYNKIGRNPDPDAVSHIGDYSLEPNAMHHDDSTATGRLHNFMNFPDKNGSEPFNILKELGGDFREQFNNAVIANDDKKAAAIYKTGVEQLAAEEIKNYDTNGNEHIGQEEFVNRTMLNEGLTDEDITRKLADAQSHGLSQEQLSTLKQKLEEEQKMTQERAVKLFERLSGLGTDNPKGKGYIDQEDFAAYFTFLDAADGKKDTHISQKGISAIGPLAEDQPTTAQNVQFLKDKYSELYP